MPKSKPRQIRLTLVPPVLLDYDGYEHLIHLLADEMMNGKHPLEQATRFTVDVEPAVEALEEE